ncbi:WD domain protein [Fusarium austroafricanum]|uniref:WD domain protein n=1 Tax=Fusarium austroafricanum TaxID=2364996 RepID=A0A8H4NSX4_9HYPO|nr:WD domain protein [Fusarium austroafricanum]
MGIRDRFEKLSSKLQRSRATSPVPPASIQQPTEDNQSTPHASSSLPERLWNEAYDELKNSESNKTIVEAYEKVLSGQLQAETSSPDNNADVTNIIASDPNARWRQMERLVQLGLEKTAKVVDKKQKVNQWLELIKPIRQAIDTGIKAAPQAAVPWAGVCCALDILSSPLTEPKKNRDGMTHVLTRMEWYWEMSRLLLDEDRPSQSSRPLRSRLETHVISLYGKLLLYEMKSVVLYHRSQFGVFMRDLPKLDDWEAQLKDIKDAEAAVERDASQYNTLEMRSSLQDISTSASVSERKLHEILLEHEQQGAWQQKVHLEEKDNECLRDLRITNPQDDKETIIKAKGGLLMESYSWVMENESYQQWINDDESRLLWIKGDPGKGKTMLLCGIINELESSAPHSVFYFFCQASEPRLRSASAVLRGLIWFLARTRPNLISHIRKEYDQAGKDIFNDHNAWQALSNIMTAMVEDETADGLVFVVDALDECTDDRDRLIALVSQLSTFSKSKWIVSSRNWPEIEAQLDGITSKVRLHLELNHASISDAVQRLIVCKVEDLARKKRYTESTRDAVLQHLLSNASDTFLWVSLVCEELGKHNVLPHHTLHILKSFPAGLDMLYQRMVAQVLGSRDQDICRAILAVVTVAFEPLSLAELAISDARLTCFHSDLETLSSIVNCCGSFLTIRNNIVYPVHQSVKDFLLTSSDIFPSSIAGQHYSIFLSSMDRMQVTLHRDLYSVHDDTLYIHEISKPPSSPLDAIRYGCIYWVDHLHKSAPDAIESPSTCILVETFLKTKYLYWLEAISLLGCVSTAIRAIRKLGSGLPETSAAELKYLTEDALRFALTHRAICDTVPLQLYDSALIFSPERSQVRQNFDSEISANIRVFPSSFQQWDACLFNIPSIGRFGRFGSEPRVSPDGERLAMMAHTDKNTILILDSFTGEIVRKIKSNQPDVLIVGFDSERKHLVTVSRHYPAVVNDTVMIWNTYTGEYVQMFEDVFDIAVLSRDRGSLALVESSGLVHVWDPWAGSCEYTVDLRHGEGKIEWIDFGLTKLGAPCFLSINSTEDSSEVSTESRPKVFVVQNPRTGHVIAKAPLASGIYKAALDPDRKLLLMAELRGELWLWDGETHLRRVFGDEDFKPCCDITWAPDGRSFAVATFDAVILCDPTKQARIERISFPSIINPRLCYVSGATLALLDWESLRMLRVCSTSSEAASVNEQALNPIFRMNPGPNGRLEISRMEGDNEIFISAIDNTLRRLHIPGSYRGCSGVFSPDHHYAFVDRSALINIWDTKSGRCLHKLRGHVNDAPSRIAIEFDPSGQLVSANHQDDCIRIWNPTTGDCLRIFGSQHWPRDLLMAASADGRIAIAPCNRKDLHTWDLGREGGGAIQWTVAQSPLCLSFSSNGLLAVLWGRMMEEKSLNILGVSLGTCLRAYRVPKGSSYARFDTNSKSRIDVGQGVLDLDLERLTEAQQEVEEKKYQVHSRNDQPPIWNPQFLKVSFTDSEAWLMRGSKKVLWVPLSTARTVNVIPNFDTGTSMVAMIHNSHALILHIGESNITLD